MNYWRILKIIGFVLLVIVLGVLALATGEPQHNSTPTQSAAPSSDGAAFNSLK